jgi:nucleotide-binding universal stress UspA family protein
MALSTISKILVPIDGSQSSMRAADAAVELARKNIVKNPLTSAFTAHISISVIRI